MKNKLSYEQTMMNTWQSEKNSHNNIYISASFCVPNTFNQFNFGCKSMKSENGECLKS